jgi:5-methyltetrahydrofolate--homocysteine methyltransferase
MSSITEESRRLRCQALEDALSTRVLVLDGAMGTMLQQRHLTAADFGGSALEGCNENLVLTRPDVIRDVHRAYYEAGADIVETNSFGGTRVVLAEYGLQDSAHRLNFEAARLAREAADEFSESGRLRFVAGSMGPTTKAITVTGGITFPELVASYYEQAKALYEGGADILLLETCQDTRNIKAGLLAIGQLGRELGFAIPTMVSGTIEATGTMLAGQTAEALYASISHAQLLSIGLNCATGPEFMTDHIRSLHELFPSRWWLVLLSEPIRLFLSPVPYWCSGAIWRKAEEGEFERRLSTTGCARRQRRSKLQNEQAPELM